MSSLRIGGQPLGEHDALLIAARQRRDRVVGMADLDAEVADPGLDQACRAVRSRSGGSGPSRLSSTAIDRVVRDRLRLNEAELQAVLRHVGDAGADRIPIAREATGLPSSATVPLAGGDMPNRLSASSVRPEPSRPVRPTISPASDGQGDVGVIRCAGQVLDRQHDRRVGQIALLHRIVEGLAGHQFGEPGLRHAFGREGADVAGRPEAP